MRVPSVLLIPLLPLLLASQALAFDAPDARRALDRVFENLYAPGVLAGVELRIERGEEQQPEWLSFAYGRKRTDDETRTLLYSPDQRPDAPRLLLFQKPGERDRVWVGDGRRGRVRPASGGEYRWSLFGSDFSYEDFRAHTADDYRIEVLGSDRIDGESCRVLRLRPLEGPYTMMLVWISTARPVIVRTDYFDKKGLWKRYRAAGDQIAQHFEWWVPMRDEMFDLRTGRRTIRRVRNIVVGADVPDDMFTLTQLSRGRLPSF